MERGGHRCALCQSTMRLEIDHIIPMSGGGTHDPSNLQVLCGPCNITKGGVRQPRRYADGIRCAWPRGCYRVTFDEVNEDPSWRCWQHAQMDETKPPAARPGTVSAYFSAEGKNKLDELKARWKTRSHSEVIRRAITEAVERGL
jgi:hypothetical protein